MFQFLKNLFSKEDSFVHEEKKEYEGDTYFPKYDKDEWAEISKKDYKDFELIELKRIDIK